MAKSEAVKIYQEWLHQSRKMTPEKFHPALVSDKTAKALGIPYERVRQGMKIASKLHAEQVLKDAPKRTGKRK